MDKQRGCKFKCKCKKKKRPSIQFIDRHWGKTTQSLNPNDQTHIHENQTRQNIWSITGDRKWAILTDSPPPWATGTRIWRDRLVSDCWCVPFGVNICLADCLLWHCRAGCYMRNLFYQGQGRRKVWCSSLRQPRFATLPFPSGQEGAHSKIKKKKKKNFRVCVFQVEHCFIFRKS